ncbi:hypothetical protein RBB78_24390 [Tunturiibacter empetritectus]|uniref:hypothetical protein n=1 Tax=Tunturiibacter empetritectus TaxID=3069691 RepID=UPI003D9B7631
MLLAPLGVRAQSSSSSSSSEGTTDTTISKEPPTKSAPRIAQPEAGGSAITLETSEPLFDLAVALNVCGYDADLANSAPVRLRIRDDINAQVAASPKPAPAGTRSAATSVSTHSTTPA